MDLPSWPFKTIIMLLLLREKKWFSFQSHNLKKTHDFVRRLLGYIRTTITLYEVKAVLSNLHGRSCISKKAYMSRPQAIMHATNL